MVRGSARIFLVTHVTTVARQFSPNLFWVFLAGYGLVTEGLEKFVLHAYSH